MTYQNNPEKSSNYQYLFKIILIGTAGVGKSSILKRYIENKFDPNYKCTIGVDFLMKSLTIQDKIVKLQLWDTAGQEKYRSMVSSYFRGANVALIIFDITSHASFEEVPLWIQFFYNNGPEQKNIILIGNKKDLENEREVTQEEAETFAKTNDMIYYETSAKDGENIQYIFNYTAEKLLEFYGSNGSNNDNYTEMKKEITPMNSQQISNFQDVRIEKTEKKCCN